VFFAALALLALTRLFEAGMGGSAFTDEEIASQEWATIYDTVASNYDPATNPDSARAEQQGRDPYQIPKDWANSLVPEAAQEGVVVYDPTTGTLRVAPRVLDPERTAAGYTDIYGANDPNNPGQLPSWDDLDDLLLQYAEAKDPAARAAIEALVYTYPDPRYFDTEEEYWQAWNDVGEILTFLNDVDAGLYDPAAEPDNTGQYWVEFPGGGGRQYGNGKGGGGKGGKGGGSSSGPPATTAGGPNAAARAYQQAQKYRKDYGSPFNSGFLRRRRKRSQVLRNFRLHKAGWIDPFPWIPGTEPEKELFEWLVRRRIYFIFQGQVPELEAGDLATLSVPGFEPDFVLPQYKIILDPFSPFHHSLPTAQLRDIQKVALYESLGYGYYHPWAIAPGLWSFDQEGVTHGRFTTEQMLNQIPELAFPPKPLPAKELPYVGIGYRLGVNLGAGATSVAAANRARVRARTLALTRRP